MADASTSPLRQEEGSDLTHMSHRLEGPRPAVKTLKADDTVQIIDGDVDRLPGGERLQITPLFLDAPGSIDGGMDPLPGDHLEHGGNSGGVCRVGAPYCQGGRG